MERKQSVVKKDTPLLKDIIETIVKLMIDIDAEIDLEWMTPKKAIESDEDNVTFG